jgi:hypothetical protein
VWYGALLAASVALQLLALALNPAVMPTASVAM